MVDALFIPVRSKFIFFGKLDCLAGSIMQPIKRRSSADKGIGVENFVEPTADLDGFGNLHGLAFLGYLFLKSLMLKAQTATQSSQI